MSKNLEQQFNYFIKNDFLFINLINDENEDLNKNVKNAIFEFNVMQATVKETSTISHFIRTQIAYKE